MDKLFLSFLRYVGGPSVIMLSAYALIKVMNKQNPAEVIESEVGGFIYGKDGFGNDLRIKLEDERPIVTVLGVSRSSKTTKVIVPNILDKEYDGGQVIYCLKKGELSETLIKPLIDLGWLVAVVDMNNPKLSMKMNPFEIYNLIQNGKGVDKLVAIFLTITSAISKVAYDMSGNDNTEWEMLSQDLLKSFVYHVCEVLPPRAMEVLVDMTLYSKAELDDILLKSPSKKARRAYKRVLSSISNIVAKSGGKIDSDKFFNSMKGLVNSKLSIFDHEEIFDITSETTFDPRWVVTGVPRRVEIKGMSGKERDTSRVIRNKVALFYVCDTVSTSHVYSGITLLFSHMIYDAMEDEKVKRKAVGDTEVLDRRVRIYMDEFLTLGRLWKLADKINTCASYKFSYIISIQNYKYFENLYDPDNADTIVKNGTFIALNDADPDSVRKLFGEYSPVDENGDKIYTDSSSMFLTEGNCLVRCKKKYFKLVKMRDPIYLKPEPIHYIEYIDPQRQLLDKYKVNISELLQEMRLRDVREKKAIEAIEMLTNKVKQLQVAGEEGEQYKELYEVAKKKIKVWEEFGNECYETFNEYNKYMKMAREYYTQIEKKSGNNIYRRVITPSKPMFDKKGNKLKGKNGNNNKSEKEEKVS